MKNKHFRLWVALIVLNLMTFTQMVEAATSLASSPLANATGNVVRPNIMYVLDDSGSMNQDFTPDYINDSTSTSQSYAMCWGVDTGTAKTILDTNQAATCAASGTSLVNLTLGTDLPAAAAALNYQFYNPDSYYKVPIKADGTSYGNMSPTNARVNGFSTSTSGAINLTTGWKHKVWCNSSGASSISSYYDAASSSFKKGSGNPASSSDSSNWTCYENNNTSGDNLYPQFVGTTPVIYEKSYDGGPTYFQMSPFEYCADAAMTNCISATSASGSYTLPSVNRWCASFNNLSNTFSGCQGRRDQTHFIPNYLGAVSDQSFGTITVPDATAAEAGKQITSITLDAPGPIVGPNLISATYTATGAVDTTARGICNAIKTGPLSGTYYVRSGSTAAMSTNTCNNAADGVIEIQRRTNDGVDNGKTISVLGPAVTSGTPATGSITINPTASVVPTRVDNITVGGTSILSPIPQNFADGTDTSFIASTLAGQISGYIATPVGNVINLTRNTPGALTSTLALVSNGVKATGTITVSNTGQTAGIPAELGTNVAGNQGIAAGGVAVVGDLTSAQITNGTATTTNATTIKNNMINGFSATCTGGGTCTSNVLTVSAPSVGSAINGTALTPIAGAVNAPTVGVPGVWPTGLITFGGSNTPNSNPSPYINDNLSGSQSVNVGTIGAEPNDITIGKNKTSAQAVSSVVSAVGTGGTIKAYVGGNAVTPICALQSTNVVCLVDTSATVTNGKAVTVGTPTNFGSKTISTTATAGGVAAIPATPGNTDFAPALVGSSFSGGMDIQPATVSGISGGTNPHPGTIGTSTTPMTDGSITPRRVNVGVFKRTDIVPTGGSNIYKSGLNDVSATMTYPKATEREDCVTTPGICTYEEELQNFANWYSYYKNRLLMMKSTSTIAFGDLDGTDYNVGFDDISNCDGSACSTSVVQSVGQFIDTCSVACTSTGTCGGTGSCQRSRWWNRLTSISASSATPLRGAVAKMGRYYAGKLTTDPVEYSCQQNFTLLVTDGYWNEGDAYSGTSTNIKKVNGTDIGNTDNVLSSAPRPYYDGQMASSSCPTLTTTKRSAVNSCRNLSDIAYYYYTTDLRNSAFSNTTNATTGLSVEEDNVFTAGNDNFSTQHMTFFAMALGIDGVLQYRPDYAEASSGDYFDIVNGTKNWPAVKNLDPTGIDDLWHAAVNGRGKYFSARNPTEVSAGLSDALTSITKRVGAAAAAATSNLQPIAGDNFAYVASYTTVDWSGDVQARTIDTTTGAVSEPLNPVPNDCVSDSGCAWSAQKKLDGKAWNTRKIYVAPASGSVLRDFTYTDLTPAEQAFFSPTPLSQYALLSPTYPSDITASNLVDFLRGDRSLETGNGSGNPQIWRGRLTVLGDIVNTQPTFVKKAISTTYADSGYAAFATAQAAREGVVYVSGNDGMLHAFAAADFQDSTAAGGEELWAFIPSQALPNLRDLADTSYVHRYYVDGPITVSDVNFGGGASDWHTILVGGMAGGGNSYYALDITDPKNPTFLWEFTHTNLGLTFGNPSMNKLPNGEWVVLFSSGYNNADGEGYLYAVDAKTGALKTGFPLSNASGTIASPSNLGKISAWVNNLEINNTATDVYSGDMNGDLWRFDLTTMSVSRLAHLADASSNAQPITTKPELTEVDGNRVIYIGTGRYLGIPDLSDTNVQTFYAIKDTDTSPSPDWDPRTDTGTIGGVSGQPMFIERKLIALKDDGTKITRTNASGATVDARQICTGASSTVDATSGDCENETGEVIDWTQHGGWYFDLPDSGERINVDMNLTLGTLTIPSNVPASNACTAGGYGWVNYIDFRTGLQIDNTMIVSEKIANALIVGINVIKVGDKLVAIVTTSDFKHDVAEPPGTPGKFKGKRDLWRELDPY